MTDSVTKLGKNRQKPWHWLHTHRKSAGTQCVNDRIHVHIYVLPIKKREMNIALWFQ